MKKLTMWEKLSLKSDKIVTRVRKLKNIDNKSLVKNPFKIK